MGRRSKSVTNHDLGSVAKMNNLQECLDNLGALEESVKSRQLAFEDWLTEQQGEIGSIKISMNQIKGEMGKMKDDIGSGFKK